MALKAKLTEADYNKLSADLKKEYTKNDDGDYVLEVEGGEDVGALKRAKDHEATERKRLAKEAKEAKEALELAQQELADAKEAGKKKQTDGEAAIEKAWKTKLEKVEKELKAQLEAANTALQTHLVDSVATTMATELAGENSELLMPHIKGRLKAEIVDGKAITRVLGADGAVSAATVDEFKKEVLSNQKFAAVLVGSKGSGGGASGSRKAGSGASKKLSEMSGLEEAQFANANPAEYAQMLASASKA